MRLRVAFADFWPDFELEKHILFHALTELSATVVDDPSEANLLIFSVFGERHRSFVGCKLRYAEENRSPRWDRADFCVGCDHLEDPRFLRLPPYVPFAFEDRRSGFAAAPGADWATREFCNFIYHWEATPMRRELFERLGAYRRVTSAGHYLRNAAEPALSPRFGDDWRRSKIAYQRRFRFTIACENSSFPGYVTEKLYDALLAGTIPIYWGSPRVAEDVDERAFINCHAFPSLNEVVERVCEIDRDPALAATYLEIADPMRVPVERHVERLVEFFGHAAAFVADATPHHARMRRRARRLRADHLLHSPATGLGRAWDAAYAWLGDRRRRLMARSATSEDA